MSGWKEVKPSNVQKIEHFIKNFWGENDYLKQPINSMYNSSTSNDIPKIVPEEVTKSYPALDELKNRLLMTKSKLDQYPSIKWSKHTNFTYLFSDLTKKLHYNYNIELCTTAWTKMWEILHEFFDRDVEKDISALFLCEGPGSFITCTNHFLKTRCTQKPNLIWSAITLVEQNNGLFNKYFPNWSPNNWFFGPDGTGDILNPNNIVNGVWPRFNQQCDLVTADGSINCQHDPNNQELIVAPIKLAEIAAGLKCLKKGGMFVIKYFTCFEPQTICQLWLLASLFRQLIVFKQLTSKPGNSEIYIICRDYYGVEDSEYFEKLVQCPPNKLLFSIDIIPKKFVTFITNTMNNIVNHQINVIENNIKLFHDKRSMNGKKINDAKELACAEYIKHYSINVLTSDNQLLV
jgi:cap2 methyltransferase